MQPRNVAHGAFGPTRAYHKAISATLFAGMLGPILVTLVDQAATQWLAHRLAYQPALGGPLFSIGTTPVYSPWRWREWIDQMSNTVGAEDLIRRVDHAVSFGHLVAVVASMLIAIQWRTRAANRADILHGSAAEGTKADLERAGLLGRDGVVIGYWRRLWKLHVLHHNGPEGVLCFAPPRSGKTIGPVWSSLLTWTESAIVLDMRGDISEATWQWRASTGQKIYCLNFSASPEDTAGFNPLDTVRIGTEKEVGDAQRLALMLVDPDGKQSEGQNAYFAETAAALITGAILHVLYRDRQQGARASLADVAAELSDSHRSHAQVLLDWCDFNHDPTGDQGWTRDGALTGVHPVVAAAARDQLNREDRERTAVLSSCTAKLALYRDPLIATNTAHSSFAIEDLMDADVPLTVYLVLTPADTKRLRPIVRIFLDCMLRRLVEKQHKRRLLLMLDEFPILGRMDVFTETFAYCAGYGILPFLLAQDYEQVRERYGDRETLSSCCNIWLAYAPNKMETAQMLATRMGKATAVVRSPRRGRNASESEQGVGRELMTANEIMRMRPASKKNGLIVKAGEMLIFVQGIPFRGEQPIYHLNPVIKSRMRKAPVPPSPEPWDRQAYRAARARHARLLAEQRAEQLAARERAQAEPLLPSPALGDIDAQAGADDGEDSDD